MRGVLVVAIASTLLAFTASAQNANAPDPSSTANILYAASNSASDRAVGWMSTDDTPGSSATVGGTTQTCVQSPVCVPQTEGIDWTWTWTLNPALGGPVQLAAGGTILVRAHIGVGTGSGSGIEMSTALMQGDKVIAEGPVQQYSYSASPAGQNYGFVEWLIPVTETTLVAGTPLVWTVRAVAAAGEAQANMFMSCGEPRGRSRIELPVIGGDTGGVGPVALSGTTVAIDETFANNTTKALDYTWNATAGNFSIAYQTAGNGTAVIMVRDAANTTLVDANVTGDANGTKRVNATEAGLWSIRVNLTDFQGRFTLNIGPAGPPTGSATPGNGNATDNGTGDKDKGKGAPAANFVSMAATVALAAVLLRRRQRA